MRAEASGLSAEVGSLGKRYESLKLSLGQLAYEDTVDEDRNDGLEAMRALKDKAAGLDAQLGEADQYYLTLQHMAHRAEAQKLAGIAQLKAFEDSIKVHAAEVRGLPWNDPERGVRGL